MKKIFNFLRENPLYVIVALVSVVLYALDNAEASGAMLAAVTVVPAGSTKPSRGIAGLATQGAGEATTVSNASELSPDLIDADVDDQIIGIASDESVIDTIKRKIRRQVRVTSFEVDHYLIDDKRSKAYTNAVYNGIKATRAEIPFSTTGERKIFQEYYTAICKGVNGYDPTGQIELPGVDLMLFFVGKNATTEAPIAMAVNGPKTNPSDDYCVVPTIPAGTEIILLSSAAYETQKFIAPSTIVPVPERMFLQKQLCNSIVSDYFAAQKKRLQFNESQIAEAVLRQFRLESCRTAWVGQPGKFKVQAMDNAMGYQWDYFSKGIRWQFKRQYDLSSKITFADLVNLSMVKFTGFNCTKRAIWLLGKQLLKKGDCVILLKHNTLFGVTEGKRVSEHIVRKLLKPLCGAFCCLHVARHYLVGLATALHHLHVAHKDGKRSSDIVRNRGYKLGICLSCLLLVLDVLKHRVSHYLNVSRQVCDLVLTLAHDNVVHIVVRNDVNVILKLLDTPDNNTEVVYQNDRQHKTACKHA